MAKESDEEQSSGSENIRRVYALPAEMVDRITAFQRAKGLSSEVEAVRRLLDEALKSRDTLTTLVNRMLSHLGQTKIISEAARDVLAGHPLVKSISFDEHQVEFTMKNGESATITEWGSVRSPIDTWTPHDSKNNYAGGTFEIPF